MKEIITAHNMSQETLHLRSRINQFRRQLMNFCDSIEQHAKVKYTGWYVLIKKDGDSFRCLGVFHPDKSREDAGPEWDICLPIPDPKSIQEFMGW